MIDIIDNQDLKRFEYHTEGHIAFTSYDMVMGRIVIQHTEVPEEIKGKGIGSNMANQILNLARENNVKVYPFCPFISG